MLGRSQRHDSIFLCKFEYDERRLERMNDSERARVRHDAPVREAAAVTEDHHIARERSGV